MKAMLECYMNLINNLKCLFSPSRYRKLDERQQELNHFSDHLNKWHIELENWQRDLEDREHLIYLVPTKPKVVKIKRTIKRKKTHARSSK